MGFLKFLFGGDGNDNAEEMLDEEFEIKSVYGWSEFYPDYCEDVYVRRIIENGAKIVIDCEIKDTDVASALGYLNKTEYQEKVFDDLCDAGFVVSEAFVVALGEQIGDEPLYSQALSMLRPPYQIETIFSIIHTEEDRADISDIEHYLRNRKGKLSFDQLIEINDYFPDLSVSAIEDALRDVRDSLTFKQVVTILEYFQNIGSNAKALLLMDIKGEPKYAIIDEIFSLIDKDLYGLMNVYVAKLKKQEQDELHETYDF